MIHIHDDHSQVGPQIGPYDLEANAKIDRLLGKMDALMTLQTEQAHQLDGIAERVVKVEQGVSETRDVVHAWGAAKTSLGFVKWAAGVVTAALALWAAIKGLQRP